MVVIISAFGPKRRSRHVCFAPLLEGKRTLAAGRLKCPVQALCTMQNGYALRSKDGLRAITDFLVQCSDDEVDDLRGKLRIGLHWDVAATETRDRMPQLVSQAFCSALPVAYAGAPRQLWRAFAILVLEAAYEATMIAAQLNARRVGMPTTKSFFLAADPTDGNHSK
jgi:hypothetical protein